MEDTQLLVQEAKRLEAETQISLYDLTVALLLENFSRLPLACTGYSPLRRRNLLPSLDDELNRFLALMPESLQKQLVEGRCLTPLQCELFPEIAEALALVGAAIARRSRLVGLIKVVTTPVLVFSVLLHISVLALIIRSAWQLNFMQVASFAGVWLLASLLAWYVCMSNRHWRPRGRLRREPS